MPTQDPLRVAFVGCGRIAGPYATRLLDHPEQLQIAGGFDLVADRAEAFVEQHGGAAFRSLDEVLGDASVEAVLNLTIHGAHHELTRAALEAGKHVHSEKPLAATREHARELVELAERKGLALGCSPYCPGTQAEHLLDASLTILEAAKEGHAKDVVTWFDTPTPLCA